MTGLRDHAAFARQFGQAVAKFRQYEEVLRHQYARDGSGNAFPRELLERATRRYLIDEMLRALGWDVDDPTQVSEEARAKSSSSERLYLDYLGIAPRSRTPVLLFEAKAFDVALPRKPHGPVLEAQSMSELIADAVNALKQGDRTQPIISEWAEYLRDMHSYITALDHLGQTNLRRAAISAGRWLIVFREPVATFVSTKPALSDTIVCFLSSNEMLTRAGILYQLLARDVLVDTLPFALDVPEALRIMPARSIGPCYRAVLVATKTDVGPRRVQYPVRSVCAAVVANSSGRWFAIVDYHNPIEEPRRQVSIASFITDLNSRGENLLGRLRNLFANEIAPNSLGQFPGFCSTPPPAASNPAAIGIRSLTVQSQDSNQPVDRFVRHTGEDGNFDEFVVVTGDTWFYKKDQHVGAPCNFHFWKTARDQQVGAVAAHDGYVGNSFTTDGEQRHCAHGDLQGLRFQRCHIRRVETHLCCRTCAYSAECWKSDDVELPCPSAPAA